MLGIVEIIIILAVVGIVLFGGPKVIELARGMGRFTGEFKKGKMEIDKELENLKQEKDEIFQSTTNNENNKSQ